MQIEEILVIGGVAAGASFAARARRLNENVHITVIERGPDVSFANCGLPYHIGGEIPARDVLAVQTPHTLKALLNLDVRTRCVAIAIDRAQKRVQVHHLETDQTEWLGYDKLMLAPGAAPLVPPLPGIDHPRIFTLRNLVDMDRITKAANSGMRAVVIGAGFIGLEMTEQLQRKGIAVHLVELQQQVLPQLDRKMTLQIEAELRHNNVILDLGEQATQFTGSERAVQVHLASGQRLDADFVVLSIGVRPETQLAKAAGLALGARGHIVVNEFMQTSDPDIYAAGDAVETKDRILGGQTVVALGGPANRQGRVAADHLFLADKARPYPGSLGTAIVRSFGVAAGITGWSEQRLQAANQPYASVTVNDHQHATYFPGAKPLTLKIMWQPDTGRLLGAEACGQEGVDKRLDVLATAITGGMSVEDLCHLELAYAPPFGAAKDIVNLAGFAACNLRDGLVEKTEELPDSSTSQIVDVRVAALAEAYPIPGAINIPIGALRHNLNKLDPQRPVVTVCSFGKMSYFAARVLSQHGYQTKSFAGGIRGNIDPRIPSKL